MFNRAGTHLGGGCVCDTGTFSINTPGIPVEQGVLKCLWRRWVLAVMAHISHCLSSRETRVFTASQG